MFTPHVTWRSLIATALLAATHLFATAASHTDPRGRWITASGNLEVEVAPCGTALCGTVTRVIANHAMGQPGQEMTPIDTRPALGMTLLIDFKRADGDEPGPWQGQIYNRENGKTYRCQMSIDGQGGLVLRAYVGLPLFGKTQTWQRTSLPSEVQP